LLLKVLAGCALRNPGRTPTLPHNSLHERAAHEFPDAQRPKHVPPGLAGLVRRRNLVVGCFGLRGVEIARGRPDRAYAAVVPWLRRLLSGGVSMPA